MVAECEGDAFINKVLAMQAGDLGLIPRVNIEAACRNTYLQSQSLGG